MPLEGEFFVCRTHRRRVHALAVRREIQGLGIKVAGSATLRRPDAGYWGHGKLPIGSGGALGCIGAASAPGGTRRAGGAVSSGRADGF